MNVKDLPAIDAHGHYGVYVNFSSNPLVNEFSGATGRAVAARARACGVEWTLVSPLAGLLPRGKADAAAANDAAYREVPSVPGLLQYVIVNPLDPRTFRQAREMLKAVSGSRKLGQVEC